VTTFVYPLFFEESESGYRIKFGVVLKEIGRYYVGFSVDPFVFERYEHPAMYKCVDERRKEVDVKYDNLSSNQEAYDSIFLKTNVDYLIELTTYEGSRNGGIHTFIVRE
ncbi:MAG: hypothetical protein AAGJ93_14875, partial [Bacteroidota bacterium]